MQSFALLVIGRNKFILHALSKMGKFKFFENIN